MTSRQLLASVHCGVPPPPPLAPYLSSLAARGPSDLAAAIARYIDLGTTHPSYCHVDPPALADLAASFHLRAGSLTTGVKGNIERLARGAPRLRTCHQVNLFMSMGVLGQLLLLNSAGELLKRDGIETALIYVALDYDIAEDSRFRIAHFPDLFSRTGSLPLTGAVPSDFHQKPMWAVPCPPAELVPKWFQHLNSLAQRHLAFLRTQGMRENKDGVIHSRIRQLEDLAIGAREVARNLVEFNAFVLSRVVNVHWDLPIAFILGSDLQPLLRPAYERVLPNSDQLAELALVACDFLTEHNVTLRGTLAGWKCAFPVWYTCPACLGRLPLTRIAAGARLVVHAICRQCDRRYEFDLGPQTSPSLAPLGIYFSPRILLDNLLDVLALRVVGGAGYIGQAEHLLITRHVARSLGIPMPPECLYTPRGLHSGLTEVGALCSFLADTPAPMTAERVIRALEWVYSSRATFLYYVASAGLEGISDTWRNSFPGASRSEHSRSGWAFSLSSEQTRVLQALSSRVLPDHAWNSGEEAR